MVVNVCCFSGIDHLLAQHISHLFIRDPISLFEQFVNPQSEDDTDHFEVGSNFSANAICKSLEIYACIAYR